MSKKKNIKRTLFTIALMLLLSLSSFLTGFIVNKAMILRIEEKIFAVSYINMEQEDYSEWQK